MPTLRPTPLEAALLRECHALYATMGFPNPKDIAIVGRRNTGGGRYVDLKSNEPPMPENGYLDLGGKFIEMAGLPNGMMAVVAISEGRPALIEIAVYGGDAWDGEERTWSIA